MSTSTSLPNRLLPCFVGVLVASLLYWMMLMQLEAPLVGMSLLLFPGVETGGSDPLRPVEGCVAGLTEELSSYHWTSGPQWEAGTAEQRWTCTRKSMKFEFQVLYPLQLFTKFWEGPWTFSDSHALFSSHFIPNRLNSPGFWIAHASEHLLEGSPLYFFSSWKEPYYRPYRSVTDY